MGEGEVGMETARGAAEGTVETTATRIAGMDLRATDTREAARTIVEVLATITINPLEAATTTTTTTTRWVFPSRSPSSRPSLTHSLTASRSLALQVAFPF